LLIPLGLSLSLKISYTGIISAIENYILNRKFMTDTPEQIKAKARALRNKPANKTPFGASDPFNGRGKDTKKGSQTAIKPPRKPSV
jgi:hypothetical protein